MKRFSVLFFFFCLFILITVFMVTAKTFCKENIVINLKRMDKSITDEEGKLIASAYYDLPVVEGDSDVSNKINEYFNDDFENWIYSRKNNFDNGLYEDFLDEVYEMKEYVDLSVMPFIYTIDSKIVFNSNNTLSILQNWSYQTSGPSGGYRHGTTFNLITGDLLPLNNFVDIDSDSFLDMVTSFFTSDEILEHSSFHFEQLSEIYDSKNHTTFIQEIEGRLIDLRYEYYYDGEYICIIINHGLYDMRGGGIRWNMKTGKEFEGVLLGYEKDGTNGVKEVIHTKPVMGLE